MRPFLVAAQGLLLFMSMSMAMPCLAQVPSSPQSRIARVERILFGESRNGKPLAQRLDAIEEFVLGRTGKGGMASRLDAVDRVIQPDSARKLMPPTAPARDRAPTQTRAAAPADPQSAPRKDLLGHHRTPAPSERMEGHVDVMVSNPANVDQLLVQGMDRYKEGKFEQAESLFQQVVAADSENANALYNLGALTERQGNLEGALRYYRLALSASPQDKQLQGIVDEIGQDLSQRQAAEARAAAERDFALAAEGARHEKVPRRNNVARYAVTMPSAQTERPGLARTEGRKSGGRGFARVFAGMALTVGASAAPGLHCPLCRMMMGF